MDVAIGVVLVALFCGAVAGYKFNDFLKDMTNCVIITISVVLLVGGGLLVHEIDGSSWGQILVALGLVVITYELVGLAVLNSKQKEEPVEEDTSDSLEERIQKLKEKNK